MEGLLYSVPGVGQQVSLMLLAYLPKLGHAGPETVCRDTEALLKRIISASSNEGDVVLDPLCGCGTAAAAAEHFNRRWIGIDITHLAITLIRHRLHDSFGDDLLAYEVIGEPKDLSTASPWLSTTDTSSSGGHSVSWTPASPATARRGPTPASTVTSTSSTCEGRVSRAGEHWTIVSKVSIKVCKSE